MFLSADGIAAISCRHHNGLYIGTRECSGAVGWLRCSNPNERVEPDEVPPRQKPRLLRRLGVLAEATPCRMIW